MGTDSLTSIQASLYRDFLATGQKLTFKKMTEIEFETLRQAGIKPENARALVDLAVKELKDQGISLTRVPFSR